MLLDEIEIVKKYLDKKLNKTMILSVDELMFYISVENLVNEYKKLESRNSTNEELIEKLIKLHDKKGW